MNEQEIRDFNRKYSGTVVLVDGPDFSDVLRIGELFVGDEGLLLTASDKKNKNRSLLYKDTTIHLRPKAKVFDFEGITFIYRYRPERQWSRGICAQNSSIENVVHLLQGAIDYHYVIPTKEVCPFSTKVLRNLFLEEPAGLEKAVAELLTGGVFSRSINNLFFLSVSLKPKVFYLWMMENIIAEVNPDTRTIVVTNRIFEQEVFDLLKREGGNYNVI